MKTRSREAPPPETESEHAEEPAVPDVSEAVMAPDKVQEEEEEPKSNEEKPEGHAKKPKKHKHKKHKRRRDLAMASQMTILSEDTEGAVPHLKLKIKLGGETFATKSVSRSSVTDAVLTEQELLQQDEDEDEEEKMVEEGDAVEATEEEAVSIMSETEIVEAEDDEEAWLEALEAGELNEHGELKKEKDVNLLTARQKALQQVKADNQEQLWELPLPSEPSEMTEEMIMKRAVRAQRRRDQALEKDLENKKQTIERLLKKQEVKSKILKMGKPKRKTEGAPQIRYINSLTGFSLSYPEGLEFPLAKSTAKSPPAVVTCGVEGCKNPKKYSCSKTGVPLCSLECYKKNQRPVLEITAT